MAMLASFRGSAQQFGGNPPSLKWKQINTDSARVIFPAGLDSQAQRVAGIVHYLASDPSSGKGSLSLGHQLRKVSIVLQNQTIIPNAYVGLAPFRSEFYLTPAMNNFDQGSIPWTDQLAVHEYRHVMQYNNFRNGLSNIMFRLFGDDGLSLAINASVPDWFFEGDAVYNETIHTNQGRGRIPLFTNAYPSLWLSQKKYSWMKLRNGSFKDYVPNHYYLGYLLVNYGREKYGPDFWTNVTRDASAYKGLIYPFQRAIRKYAGVDYENFRQQAFSWYRDLFHQKLMDEKNADPTAPVAKEIFPAHKKFVTDYSFPYSLGGDSLLFLESSYRKRTGFYISHAGRKKLLRIKDISIDDQYSYRNGKIVYAAYETDPRWSWRDYSVIKILDIRSGQQQTLKHKTKYFTPDISPDGSKIAAVLSASNGLNELHILDAQNGAILQTVRSGDIGLYTDPKFIDEHSLVTAVRLKDGKMALAIVDLTNGSTTRLTPPSFNVVGYPCVNEGKVYFTASYGGNDDVFALQLDNGKIFRISNGPLGNYFVNAANGKITWSAFTADGYQLRQVNENAVTWIETPANTVSHLIPPFPVSHSNEFHDILLDSLSPRRFPVTHYSKGTKLLNLHSWRPYYSNPEFTFSIYGENVLNTLETEIYYLYNQDEKTNAVGLSATYGAWFPYLGLGTQYTFNRHGAVGNKTRQWDELDTRIGLNVPINITSGRAFKGFNIGTYYTYRNEFNKGLFKDSSGYSNFSYLQHFISWSEQIQSPVQHFYPRLGYVLNLNQVEAITKYKGAYQFVANAALYLPGFLSTHNIILTGAFQQTDTSYGGLFSNQFAYARGYNGRYFSRMWDISANYHLPLFYPDWGFGNILYLQRVRLNGFYDYTRVFSRDKKLFADQRSYGGELFVDTKWWNQYPLTFGFRISHVMDYDQFDGFRGTRFEFVLPVSILPK